MILGDMYIGFGMCYNRLGSGVDMDTLVFGASFAKDFAAAS